MSKIKDLRVQIKNSSDEELKKMLFNYKKELFNLRFQKVLGELKNTNAFLIARKQIARINTEISARVSKAR